MDDRLDGFLHILHADIFVFAVKSHLSGEQIGTGQSHKGKTGSIRPAASAAFFDLDSCAPDGLYRMLHNLRVTVQHLFHIPILFGDGDVRRRAGEDGKGIGYLFAKMLFVCNKPRCNKIANDEFDRRLFGNPRHADGMDETISALCRLGRPFPFGERIDKMRSYFSGVDQFIFRISGMSGDAMKGDGHRIGGKGFVFNGSALAGIQGIGDIRTETDQVDLIHPPADLFVGRKQYPDPAMFPAGVRNQEMDHIHNNRDAGLIVGSQQGRAARGDKIVAFARPQIRMFADADHLRRVVGKHDVGSVKAMMHYRVDALPAAIRGGIHVCTKTKHRHRLFGIGGERRIHIAPFIQPRIVQTGRMQFLRQETAQVLLLFGGRAGFRLGIALCVDPGITDKSFRHGKSIVLEHVRKFEGSARSGANIPSMTEEAIKNPVIRQGWLRVLLFGAVFVVLTLLIAIPAALLVARVPAAQLKEEPITALSGLLTGNYLWLMIVAELLISVISVGAFRIWIDRRSPVDSGWSPEGFTNEALLGVFMGPALLGIVALLMLGTGHLEWTDMVWAPSSLFVSLGLMGLISFSEELVFRGYVLGNLLESIPNKWTALVISAILFAAFHFPNPSIYALAFVNLFLAGLLLGLNYIYTKNLWFSFFFHLSWNYFAGPILGFHVSGLSQPSLLVAETKGDLLITGGDFGLEGSILTTVVAAIAFFVLLWAFERKYTSSAAPLTA